jgi:hypothetical protein
MRFVYASSNVVVVLYVFIKRNACGMTNAIHIRKSYCYYIGTSYNGLPYFQRLQNLQVITRGSDVGAARQNVVAKVGYRFQMQRRKHCGY